MQLDMVRPGIILYGLAPSQELDGKYPLRPVMQLRSVVSNIKKLEAGATVTRYRENHGICILAANPALAAQLLELVE